MCSFELLTHKRVKLKLVHHVCKMSSYPCADHYAMLKSSGQPSSDM